MVIKFNNKHDHEVSRELFKHLSSQRKLSKDDRSIASELLEMGVNKTLLQEKLMQKSGKVVILKDLFNIEQNAKGSGPRNDLGSMLSKVKNRYNADFAILGDTDSNFNGLFFQDNEMKDIFNAYPEVLCIDTTFKLTQLCLPVYIFLVEDGLGPSEICGVALLVHEDEKSVRWMLNAFKEYNPRSLETRAVMTDKDVNE